jgi:hypothetical protein
MQHGTWINSARPDERITACYFEDGFTRLTNSVGQDWVVDAAEWDSRRQYLEGIGWRRQLTTHELWDATHAALCEHRWADARALLDDLGLRNDNHDLLASAATYGLVGPYTPVIQDRIDLVNAKVGS